MPHYYVSIQPDHQVFKYVGCINGLNEESHHKAFEKYGPGGIDNPHAKGGPYQVIKFDRYEGDRIRGDGTLYGKQKYSPKQLIMTWRKDNHILRMMWSQKSSPDEENKGFAHALTEGYVMHAFQVGDESAWDMALNQHRGIEAH